MKTTQALLPESGTPAVSLVYQRILDKNAVAAPHLVRLGVDNSASGGSAVVTRVDWQTNYVKAALPDDVITAEALVQKHIAAGRGVKLAAARMRLSKRMSGDQPQSLQEARLRAGLSQSDLAAKLGTSQPRIALLEAGRENPGLKTLRKLCEALEIDMNALTAIL